MLIRIFCLWIAFLAGSSHAEVREIDRMDKIIDEIDQHTLVVFDIDNTLIEPTTYMGSDQWFYFLVKELQEKNHFSIDAAIKSAEQIWNRIQSHIITQPVEATTALWIDNLQKRGISVMALTARSHAIAAITKQQLYQNHINFAQMPNAHITIDNNAIYDDGILYQGENNDKGKSLVNFLTKTNLKPNKIIFIDDKQKNTASVHKALEDLGGITHIEFRYGYCDKTVDDFNKMADELSDSATLLSMLSLDHRNIDEIVKDRAQAILNLKERGEIFLDQGRLSLVQEMLKDPSQLGKDLPRLKHIKVGDAWVAHQSRQGKTPEQELLLLGNLLTDYVKLQNRAMVDEISAPGRLGKFWITEILYTLSQNFSGPAFSLALKRSVLKSGEWASPAGTAKQRASFTIDPLNQNILTMSFLCKRAMSNLVDSHKEDVTLVTDSKIIFNLKNGQVRFLFSYTVNGKGSMRASPVML